MTTVNMLDAKTRLSQLVQAVESGDEAEIVIARNGKPAARLVPMMVQTRPRIRLGLATGFSGLSDLLTSPQAEVRVEEAMAESWNEDVSTGQDTVPSDPSTVPDGR